MRTKQLKVNGMKQDAVLVCGGPGFKIYTLPDHWALATPKQVHTFRSSAALERDTGEPLERDTGEPLERDTGGPLERDTGGPLERDTGEPLERDTDTKTIAEYVNLRHYPASLQKGIEQKFSALLKRCNSQQKEQA